MSHPDHHYSNVRFLTTNRSIVVTSLHASSVYVRLCEALGCPKSFTKSLTTVAVKGFFVTEATQYCIMVVSNQGSRANWRESWHASLVWWLERPDAPVWSCLWYWRFWQPNENMSGIKWVRWKISKELLCKLPCRYARQMSHYFQIK